MADRNVVGAQAVADELCDAWLPPCGGGRVDITDEPAVIELLARTVLE